MSDAPAVRPLQPVRRFDVCAETKCLEALALGEPDDVAKGYGIRIAKVVASRRFGGAAKSSQHDKSRKDPKDSFSTTDRFACEDGKFRALDGSCRLTRPSTMRSSIAWAPNSTRRSSRQRSTTHSRLAASTSNSGTPSARTGSLPDRNSGRNHPVS